MVYDMIFECSLGILLIVQRCPIVGGKCYLPCMVALPKGGIPPGIRWHSNYVNACYTLLR